MEEKKLFGNSGEPPKTPRSVKIILFLMALVFLMYSGCSLYTKRVMWKEEIELNSGETIWITRTHLYNIGGTGELALTPGFVYKGNAIEFKLNGSDYKWSGTESIKALVVDSVGVPSLIAYSGGECGRPLQFKFLAKGQWDLVGKTESWLNDLNINLTSLEPFKNNSIQSEGKLPKWEVETYIRRAYGQNIKIELHKRPKNCN
jgi:hypothetical protein